MWKTLQCRLESSDRFDSYLALSVSYELLDVDDDLHFNVINHQVSYYQLTFIFYTPNQASHRLHQATCDLLKRISTPISLFDLKYEFA